MTWGEMVEADYLRAYRSKGVSLQAIHDVLAARYARGRATGIPITDSLVRFLAKGVAG